MRDGRSLPTASARRASPCCTWPAANASAPRLAAHTPTLVWVCIGGAPSSPCTMLAKPGMIASPPLVPQASRSTASRPQPASASAARTAAAAICALLSRVRPSGPIA